MRSINRATLLGCLGRDAETKYMPSGVALTTFSLATTRSVKDGKSGEYHDDTDWHNVALWRAEKLAEYLKSGVRVYIEGRLQTRTWEDNEGNRRQATQVIAEAADFAWQPERQRPRQTERQRRRPAETSTRAPATCVRSREGLSVLIVQSLHFEIHE